MSKDDSKSAGWCFCVSGDGMPKENSPFINSSAASDADKSQYDGKNMALFEVRRVFINQYKTNSFINNITVCLCVAGGDGYQSNGLLSAQQSGQLLQPADRQQRARRGRE